MENYIGTGQERAADPHLHKLSEWPSTLQNWQRGTSTATPGSLNTYP